MKFPEIKLWHILVLALTVRATIYLLLNVWLFGWELEHPDSYYYIFVANELKESWLVGDIKIVEYPTYSNLIAFLYLINPTRILPEFLNIIVSLATVASIYYVVKNLTNNKHAPTVAALIFALDPYVSYLSTQLLRDALIIFSFSIIMLALTSNKMKTIIMGILVLGVLRPIQAIALTPFLFMFIRSRKAVFFGMVPLTLIIFHYFIFGLLIYPTATLFATPSEPRTIVGYNEDKMDRPHTDFFEPRTDHIPYYLGYKQPQVYLNPRLIYQNTRDFFLYPNPFKSDNITELLFSTYMIYWYLILATSILGFMALPKMKFEAYAFALTGIALGLMLAFSIPSQGGFIRWRTEAYLLMLPMISISVASLLGYEARRRVLDILICISSLVVLVIIPVIPTIIVLLLLTPRSGRKIFFKQERTGRYGKRFYIHKFVTMVPESDGVALSNEDPRLTKLGAILRKTALDEIPEIWNILKGDMAVIGPRPLAVWEDERFEREVPRWNERYQVMPGLTGLAQLNSKREDHVSKVHYDLQYIENRSTRFDLWIFYRGSLNNLMGRWH